MKHTYSWTGDTQDHFGITLYRIVRDDGLPGGWIQSWQNLDTSDGDAWVYGDAWGGR